MISYSLKTLKELKKAKAAKKEELEYQEAATASLAKATNFLANLVVDPKAFARLLDSFQEGLGFASNTP